MLTHSDRFLHTWIALLALVAGTLVHGKLQERKSAYAGSVAALGRPAEAARQLKLFKSVPTEFVRLAPE